MSKVTKMTEEMAKKVWLAGLGIYSLTNEKTKEKMSEQEQRLAKEFEELVAKGQVIEDEMRGKVKEVEEKVKEKINKELDEKANLVKNVFGMKKENSEDKIDELTSKVDALTEVVAKLATSKEEKKD